MVTDGAHGAFFGIGDGDDMAGPFFAQGCLEALSNNHELGGGLCGLARFGDDIEQGLFRIADFEDRIKVHRINIVNDKDARPISYFGGLEIMSRWVEGGLEGDVAQG